MVYAEEIQCMWQGGVASIHLFFSFYFLFTYMETSPLLAAKYLFDLHAYSTLIL